MITQAYIKTTHICCFFSLPIYTPISTSGISPKDMGYEIDEDELAGEMLAPLPACFQDSPAPEIDPDEFEAAYNWFLS